MLELEVCRAGIREGKMDVNVGDRGHIGAHKHKLDPPADGLEPMSLTTSNFNDVGVLQKKLVPFTTELNMHLA